jgi:hypothetical protein
MSLRNCLAALAVMGCFTTSTVVLACKAPPPAVQRQMARAQIEHALADIGKRLPAATLADADLARLKDLRALAVKSAAAGNTKKANDRIGEILKILGVPYVAVYGQPTKCG